MQTHRRTFSTDSLYPEKEHIPSCPAAASTPPNKPKAAISEKRFSVVGKWFCDRLLRVKIPQNPSTQPPKILEEDLVTQLQSFRPMSGHQEADTLNNVLKECSNQAYVSVGVLGHGSDVFLNAILDTSLEDETTCSLVEHAETNHLRSPSLDTIQTKQQKAFIDPTTTYFTSTATISDGFLVKETEQSTNEEESSSTPQISFRYGTTPEIIAEFRRDFRVSSQTNSILKGKVFVGQKVRFSGRGKDLKSDLLSLREKLHILQEKFSANIKQIEFRLPCRLLRGNKEFVFYGTNGPAEYHSDSEYSKLLGIHCLICVVDEQGLNPSLRNFLVQSGFLHKLIRHPQDFQIIFLMDETSLVSFSCEDLEAILRQQYVALLKEHAPGPYSITAPRLVATTKILSIRAQEYVNLCHKNSSHQQKQATGIPSVLCTIQNLAICNCAASITNISQDWIQQKSKESCARSSFSPRGITKSPSSYRSNSEILSGDLRNAFRSLKSEIISATQQIDLAIAKVSKKSFITWNEQNQHSAYAFDASINLFDNLMHVISSCLKDEYPALLEDSLFPSTMGSSQIHQITNATCNLLTDCLRDVGAFKTLPSETDKIRAKRLAEFCHNVSKRVLSDMQNISSTLEQVNPSAFVKEACQHILMSSSLHSSPSSLSGGATMTRANSPANSSFPRHTLLSYDIFSNLPLKVTQRIRMKFADLSSKTLSLLTEVENHLATTKKTVLYVLKSSHEELTRNKSIHEILTNPLAPSSIGKTSFLPFRPFTNLFFDSSEWSLLSGMGLSLFPNNSMFYQQLKEMNLQCYCSDSNHPANAHNSLFRALAHQIYGSEALFPVVRFLICYEILTNSKTYDPYFLASPWNLQEYVHRMSCDSEPADHLCLLAFVNYYKVNLWLYSPVLSSPVFVSSSHKQSAALSHPCYISYQQGKQFFSLVKPTNSNSPANQHQHHHHPSSGHTSNSISKKRSRLLLEANFDEPYPPNPDLVPVPYPPDAHSSSSYDLPPNKLRKYNDSESMFLCSSMEGQKQEDTDADTDAEMVEITQSFVPYREGYGILSLVELCTQAIAKNVHLLPPLEASLPFDLVQGIITKTIQEDKMNDQVLQCLLSGYSIDSLNVSHSNQIDYAVCAVIAQHSPTLRDLTIEGCYRIPDDGFTLLMQSFASHSNSLEFLNLSGCSQLSNNALQRIPLHSPNLRNICLDGCIELRDTCFYDLLENCPHLEVLSANDCISLTDQAFTSSSSPLHLSKISLSGCNSISDSSIISLAQRCGEKLQSISLSGNRIGDAAAKVLAGFCTNLRSVTFTGTSISDSSIRCFSIRCESLESLNVSHCKQLTCMMFHPSQGSISTVPNWKCFLSLKSLDISHCVNVDDTTLQAVAHWLPPLQYLNLAACEKVSDRGLNQVLQHCSSSLSHLDVSQCNQLTDVSVVQIALSCSSLQYLSLYNCKEITDFSMEHLAAHCTHLQYLDLSSCQKLTDEGFKHLNFPSLRTLNLEDSSISDSAAALIISKSPLLTHANLAFCPSIHQETMRSLTLCKELTCLDISYCNSIPLPCLQNALDELSNLKQLHLRGYSQLTSKMISHASLRVLNLSWCKLLTNNAIAQMTTCLPKLEQLDASFCASVSLALLQNYAASSLRSFVAKGF